jgi:hypothetical protein
MESTQFDLRHMIPHYLAGQLPAKEGNAFERALSEQPDLRDETEQILKFKEGLARLHERGELDALMHSPTPRRWLTYAAAAAVAIVTFGGLLWLQVSNRAPTMLALSPKEFATRGHEAPSVLGSYMLARTRGGAPGTEVKAPQVPGAIEFRVLPSALSTNVHYNVRVSRIGGSTNGTIVGQIDAGLASPDGYVTIYLDSQQLTPGDYEVSLAPSAGRGATDEGDRFVLRVR